MIREVVGHDVIGVSGVEAAASGSKWETNPPSFIRSFLPPAFLLPCSASLEESNQREDTASSSQCFSSQIRRGGEKGACRDKWGHEWSCRSPAGLGGPPVENLMSVNWAMAGKGS